MCYLLICLLVFQIGCTSTAQQMTAEIQQQKAERKPFQKSSVVIRSPTKYLNRETEKGMYEPRPKVVPVDEKAGKYELRWIGYDRKQKIVKYQRADALDATAEAFIEKNAEGRILYKYRINNWVSSPAHLSGFVVQTFASDVKDEMVPQGDDIHIGHMSSNIPGFSEGVWRRFAPLYEKSARITGGKSVVFSLVSSAIPGIVRCRATGGDLMLKGVGEHMPSELELIMPGYEVWASGYTIGPVDELSSKSEAERSRYVLENLPKFQEAGWMSAGTARIYKSILEKEDLAGVLAQAKKDFEKEFITSEVFHIIDGLNQ